MVSWRNKKISIFFVQKNSFLEFKALNKRGNPHTIFLISPQKHILWVLITGTSWRNKKQYVYFLFEALRTFSEGKKKKNDTLLQLACWIMTTLIFNPLCRVDLPQLCRKVYF